MFFARKTAFELLTNLKPVGNVAALYTPSTNACPVAERERNEEQDAVPLETLRPYEARGPTHAAAVQISLQGFKAIGRQLSGTLFRVKNQFFETKLTLPMEPGYLLALGPEELAGFLMRNYVLIAGDGTGRQLQGADLNTWQRIFRYLVSDRSPLVGPPVSQPLYSPKPCEDELPELSPRWRGSEGLSKLFSLEV